MSLLYTRLIIPLTSSHVYNKQSCRLELSAYGHVADRVAGRRRKIKCIFRDDRPNVCNECFARGIRCVDQESAAESQTIETKQSLRERVANLESLVKTLATKVDGEDNSSSDRSVSHGHAAVDLAGTSSGLDHAPIMSLFNNSIIDGRAEPEPIEQGIASSLCRRTKPEEDKIRQRLLTYVPSNKDIDKIWDECSYWWHVWARMFPELSIQGSQSICQYTKSAIAGGSALTLSKTLLCLSLGLQQLSASFVTENLNLPIPADQLAYHYINTIEKYVFSDDQVLTTLEGLELTIILTKLNANAGRPRKAWLQYRRAVSFALLLGLNRKSMWQVTSADPTTGPRRRAVFWALFQGDRYFSLILGLPYSLSDQQCDIEEITKHNMDLRGVGAEHMFRLSNLGGRIIDRCQNPSLVSLNTTMQWDEELKEASRTLPSLKDIEKMRHFTFDELYDRSLAVLYHHYIRTLLHLPFMLKSTSDRRFEYNRLAALDSAREMIHAFKVLRDGIHGGYCACKTVDFQVFLGCILLALNQLAFIPLLGQTSATSEDLADWQLVKIVRDLLKKAAKESLGHNGSMQDSAAKTLDLLLECKDGCEDEDREESTKVGVPYFGTITIRPRKEAAIALERARKKMLTPAQTLSSCGSPASQQSQQWQLPTPPRGPGSLSGTSSVTDSISPMANSYMAFDPVNIPLPAGLNNLNSGVADTSDFALDGSLMMNDWASGANWWALPGDGIDLDLDNEWKWVTGSDQMAAQQGLLNPLQGQEMSGSNGSM